MGDGDGASSASANGHWPGALKPLPVLLMTRPGLVSRPRTSGCRGPGYFPRAGRGVLRHPLGLPTRGVGAPRAPPLLCTATTSARATSVASPWRWGAGVPGADVPARILGARPHARCAVQARNGSARLGGGASPGGSGGSGGGGGIFVRARGRRWRRRGRRRKRRRGRRFLPRPPLVRAGTGMGTPHSLLLRYGKVFSRLLRPECGIYTSFFPSSLFPKARWTLFPFSFSLCLCLVSL